MEEKMEEVKTEISEEKEPELPLADVNAARESVYRQFEENEKPEILIEEKKEEVKITEPASEKAEKEKAVYEKLAEIPVIKEDKEKEKVVPLAALHEEREKRKYVQKVARDLENKYSTVLVELEAIKKKMEAAPNTEIPEIADWDFLAKEVMVLRDNMREISKRDKEREMTFEKTNREIMEAKFKTSINAVDQGLESEGYPGFSLFKEQVTNELIQLVNEDPDNIYLDTPNGWKKIYKETVFPRIKTIFLGKDKEEKRLSKEDAKKDAQLAGASGRIEKKEAKEEAKEEDWTYEDYMKERRKNQLG